MQRGDAELLVRDRIREFLCELSEAAAAQGWCRMRARRDVFLDRWGEIGLVLGPGA